MTDTQKVVVNRGYGGFNIQDSVVRWMRKQGSDLAEKLTLPGEQYSDGSQRDEDGFRNCVYPRDSAIRTDETLIQAVEDGRTIDLTIVEIPEGVEWVITEYDGAETVRERHRTFPSGEYATGIANSYEDDDQ